MMHIRSFWLIGGHKLKLTGTYTGEKWNNPGLATCLLHCETCNEWWPVSGWFENHSKSLMELKDLSNELHRTE